jgi:sortase A
MMRRRCLRWMALVLALAAGAQLAAAAYIPAKAVAAQWLLREAWRRSAEGGTVKPWPWADTHPVARLWVPRLGREQIVLAGDSGSALAFGPGWVQASAPPGRVGRTVIGGHRDTHFAFLRELKAGDHLLLEAPDGRRARFSVSNIEVVDARSAQLPLDGPPGLTLVTCYPFDAIAPGGPLRYLVHARPLAEAARLGLAKAE